MHTCIVVIAAIRTIIAPELCLPAVRLEYGYFSFESAASKSSHRRPKEVLIDSGQVAL